jgi:DNA-binding GntR family transcriptional regulator
MAKFKPLARQAAEDWALSEVRSAILAGTLPPGTRVRQEELAAQLGVSRMPVRQALLALEREGFVQTDRWHGTIVTPLSAELVRDLYGFRAVIEKHVAGTLARQQEFDSSAVREVLKAGRKAVSLGNIERASELDLRFHTMLYDALGNQVLSSIMEGQWAHIRRVMAVTLSLPTFPKRVWDEHTSLIEAIEEHDASRAAAEAEAHMTAACAALLTQLGNMGDTQKSENERPRRERTPRKRKSTSKARPAREA